MNYKTITAFSAGLLVLWLPTLVFGQALSYKPLVGIPGISDPGLKFGDYINAIYALSISIAALVAVIKIVIAGMKYMLSDVVTSKSEAISDIQGSVFGLIIVISAVLILTVINPNLTKTEIFLDPTTSTPNTSVGSGSGTITRAQGYYYAQAGSVENFSTTCTGVAGSIYRRESGNEVCYAPLPPATKSAIDSLFNLATDPSGREYYPAANRTDVLNRYQTAHYPRLIENISGIRADHSASEVLVGISITASNDWLDKANRSYLVTTCDELQRATGKAVRYVSGGNFTAGSGYIACIVN